ncbi:hypothetical protein HYH02_014732 [Chlamydomonas schloesseri]|uniref:Uncharacterized protein n=1 Tax=Chlamydomonas schloesseri TaxID=2026947 RepID=A0A835SKJ3_9CHLO|nr:hypothetical protein HYH02_014732 [Chlamydomonas schloesseri]|eukprot:KAG2426692.1 hypothetical protein HYH02_014732 [Chlamydomonas schloesseri]
MEWNPQQPEPEIRDHTGLYNAPNSLDCARWSEDNLLAIAAGASITILDPATLGITRAFAPYRSVDLSVWAPGFRPREWVDSPQFALAAVTEVNVQAAAAEQGWRLVAWSPAGCTPSGGCYLAALSTDHKVRLLAPAVGAMSSEWGVALDVSELMKNTMQAMDWRDVDALVASSPAGGGAMRLRGGCSRAPGGGHADDSSSAAGTAATQAGAAGVGDCAGGAPDWDSNVLRLRGGGGEDKKPAARPPAAGGGGAAAGTGGGGTGPARVKQETAAGDAEVADGADGPAAKRARGSDGAVVAAGSSKGGRPSGVAPNTSAAAKRPQSAKGAGAAVQFCVGDRVEVHNAEEGLTGGWFSARLVGLSDPQHRYGLVEYDELQASEEEGSPKLTEWFPLPGAPKLLTSAAARAVLPAEPAYTVHAKKGYAVRPAPPPTLAVSPPDGPLRLGSALDVYHDGAWWGGELVGVAGQPHDLKRLAAGPGTGGGAAGDSGSGGTVVMSLQLLDAPDRVQVPPERTRFRLTWNERTATWSSSRGRGVNGDMLPGLPAAYMDVVLLNGGGGAEAAAEALLPALVQRLEALRAEAAEAAGGEEEEEDGDELELWSSAVEAAGQEVLMAFAPELRLLKLDGKWLWQALRGQVASRAGASSPDQLPVPSWALTGKPQQQQPKPQPAKSQSATAGKGAAKAGPPAQPSKKEEPEADRSQAPGPTASIATAGGKAKAKAAGGATGGGSGGGEGGSAKKPRKSAAAVAAAAEDEPPLDFSGTDPATFEPYDKRTQEEKGSGDGAALEKAGQYMVFKRFQALLAAVDKSTIRAYGAGERISGAELRLFNQAMGEFVHLFGGKLPEGAEKRISQAAKPRCRQLLPKMAKEGGEQETADGEEAQQGAAGGEAKNVASGDGVRPQGAASPKPRKERKPRASAAAATATTAAEAEDEPPLDFSGTDPATFEPYDKRTQEEKESGDGAALEKAGQYMVFKRFQALLAAADKSTIRAYGAGERISGAELRLFNQAMGEFVHLFGGKLPEGAEKRISQAAKPRCRQLLPKMAKEGGEQEAADGEEAQQGAAGGEEGLGYPQISSPKPRKERKPRASAAAATATTAAEAEDEPPLDFSGTDPATFEPYDKRTQEEKETDDAFALEQAAALMVYKRFVALISAADKTTLRAYGPGERMADTELRLYNQAWGEFMHLFGEKLPEGADKRVALAAKPRCRKYLPSTEKEGGEEGAGDDSRKAAQGEGDAAAAGGDAAAAAGAKPKKGHKSRASGPAPEAEDEPPLDFSGTDPATFEPYDKRSKEDKESGDGAALEKAASQMVIKRFQALMAATDESKLHTYGTGERLRGTELRLFNQALGEFMHLFGDKLPEGAGKKLVLATKPRCRQTCRTQKPTTATATGAAAAPGAGDADARAPVEDGSEDGAPDAAPAAAGAAPAPAAADAGPSSGKGTGAKRRRTTGAGEAEAAGDYSGTDPQVFAPFDSRPPHQRDQYGKVLERSAAGMVVGRYFRLVRDVDKSTLRAYAPGEQLVGTELRLCSQAWGEFMHVYGDKLTEDAVKRVYKETRRRIRVVIARGQNDDPGADGLHSPAGAEQTAAAAAGKKAAAAAAAAPPLDSPDESAGDGPGDAMDVNDALAPKPRAQQPKPKPKAAEGESNVTAPSRKEATAVAAAAAGAAPRRAARAAALKAVVANRKVVAGGGGSDSTDGDDSEDNDEGGGGEGGGATGKVSAKKRKRAKSDEEEATDGASSDFNASDEAEDTSDDDDEVSVDEDASQEEDGGSGAAEDDDDDDVLDVAGGDTGRERTPKQGRPKMVVALVTRAEAQQAVAAAVAAATRDLLEGYAPPAVNLDDEGGLKRAAHHIIANRFKALRLGCKEPLHVYGRGDYLCGPDVRFWEQAAGEFQTVFGSRLDAADIKKVHQNAKAAIRKYLSEVATGVPYKAPFNGMSRKSVGGKSKSVPSSIFDSMGTKPRTEMQRGIRCSAALKGNLKIGYRAPEDEDAGGGGGASTDGTGASESDGEAGGARENAAPPAPPVPKETWALTSKCIGRWPDVKYSVELSGGTGGRPAGAGEAGGTGAYGGGGRRVGPKPRRVGGIPSYAIRFHGYCKDDHRFLALNAQRSASNLVSGGPCVPEHLYEARTLALSAVCLAWSPLYTQPATSPAPPPQAAQAPQPPPPPPLSRSCVLAVGNKLGQVSMWRMDVGLGPAQQPPEQAAGAGPGQPRLHWLGMLGAAGGGSGSHVARLLWLVAPEDAAPVADDDNGAGVGQGAAAAVASLQGQWRVPQPKSAGPRDSLLLLTASTDGSIVLWGAPVASFSRAADMRRLATLCHADGLPASCLDVTWLLALRPPRPGGAAAQGAGGAATGAEPMEVDGTADADTAAARPLVLAGTRSPKGRAANGTGGTATAAGAGGAGVEAEAFRETGTNGAAGPIQGSGAGGSGVDEAAELDDAAWEEADLVAAGPWARRLLVVAGKPSGAVFAWRSGYWRPQGLVPPAADWAEPAAGQAGGSCSCSPTLSEALSAGGGAVSCLRMGAHGTYHTSGVALVASRPHLMTTGVDGSVRSWRVRELRLPAARGAAAVAAGAGAAPELVALRLEEVPDGVARLDPCSQGLRQLPVKVRNLPLSRQAVHSVAPSGNGLVVAAVRVAVTRGSEAVQTSMVFDRVVQATVHLLTLYGGGPGGGGGGGVEASASAVAPLTPPPPGLVGAGLLFQPPTASALWDIHAVLVLRPGLAAAAGLPLKGVNEAAWTLWAGGEGASAADDDAMLEQVQPADDEGDDPDGAISGSADIGRRRLAALIRRDAEERRRNKVASCLSYLAAAATSLQRMEALVALLEAPYTAAAGAVAEAEAEAEARMETGDGTGAGAGASLYALMGGADLIRDVVPELAPEDKDDGAKAPQAAPGGQADSGSGGGGASMSRWGWSGLRTATVMRRLLLGALAGRSDAAAVGGLGEALAAVDEGVLQRLGELDRPLAARLEAAPGAHEACCSAAARNEVELLQAHIWATLSSGLAYCGVSAQQVAAAEPTVHPGANTGVHTAAGQPAGGRAGPATATATAATPSRKQAGRSGKGKGGGAQPEPEAEAEATPAQNPAHQAQPLHRLLMSDWVALHVHHSALRASELLPLAARVYVAAGEDPPLDCPPPGREHTALSALPVALGGSGRGMLESAALAEVSLGTAAAGGEAGAEGLSLTLPRCACTLMLCDTPDAWSCGVCMRRYRLPPTRRLQQPHIPPLPFCLFCGVRLSRDVACGAFLLQPCLPNTGAIKLEPATA